MNPEAVETALTLDRLISYTGFVLWAGTLAFWSLIWPGGHRDRRLFGLAMAGAGLLTVGTVAEPLIRVGLGGQPLAEFAPPLAGAAVLVRLAVVIGWAFFLVDLVSAEVTGGRRIMAIVSVIVVAATMAFPGANGGRGTVLLTLGGVGYLLATAAWLGGLGGLALVLRPGGTARPADHLLSRFSPVAMLSLVVLVVIGGGAALATSGGPDGQGDVRFWLVLAVKIGFLGALLFLVSQFRRYAARAAFRQLYHLPAGGARTVQARGRLTLVFGMEVAVAFAVLITTGLLMMVALAG